MCVRLYVRCVWVAFVNRQLAFVGCCFACGCVLERVVFRVRFARVSCPWLRFEEDTGTGRYRRGKEAWKQNEQPTQRHNERWERAGNLYTRGVEGCARTSEG